MHSVLVVRKSAFHTLGQNSFEPDPAKGTSEKQTHLGKASALHPAGQSACQRIAQRNEWLRGQS